MKRERQGTALTKMSYFFTRLEVKKCCSQSVVPLRKISREQHWQGLNPLPSLLPDSANRNGGERQGTTGNSTYKKRLEND